MDGEGQEVTHLGKQSLRLWASSLAETEGMSPGFHPWELGRGRQGNGESGTCAGPSQVGSPDLRPHPPRSARESEDEDEEEERPQSASRGCTLQYRHATLQVFTQFHTMSSEGTDQVVTMLGPDWLVEVTDLVSDFMRVGDPRVARMVDSSTLAGLEPGTTPFKVGMG